MEIRYGVKETEKGIALCGAVTDSLRSGVRGVLYAQSIKREKERRERCKEL